MSRDLDKAKDFYGKVFGWEATQSEEAPPGFSATGSSRASGGRRASAG